MTKAGVSVILACLYKADVQKQLKVQAVRQSQQMGMMNHESSILYLFMSGLLRRQARLLQEEMLPKLPFFKKIETHTADMLLQ